MPKSLSFVLLVPVVMSVAACGGNPSPPDGPPPLTSAPPLEEGWHAVHETTKVIDAPLVPLARWIDEGKEIVGAMEETDEIKKPIDLRVVKGTWPEPGSVRWLKFSDGHYTYERVLVNELPYHFKYQVWGITSSASNHIIYAQGQQDWRVLEDGSSEYKWTYRLRPNSIIKRPFVQGFLNNDMKPFMEGALDRLAAKAEVELAGWREQGLEPTLDDTMP